MKASRWKVKSGMDMTSAPSIKGMRFGGGYFRHAPVRLDANLETHSMTPFIFREETMALGSPLAEYGGWEAFLWIPPYDYRQIKVTCTKRSSQVSMLCVEFSAEFGQVVNRCRMSGRKH